MECRAFSAYRIAGTKEDKTMKAAIIITGTRPMLILTSYESVTHASLVMKLAAKGIKEFIGFDIPLQKVKKRYGTRFSVVMGELHETVDLRVLD